MCVCVCVRGERGAQKTRAPSIRQNILSHTKIFIPELFQDITLFVLLYLECQLIQDNLNLALDVINNVQTLWNHSTPFKDVRGWQFLTIEASETLCMVCLLPEEHIFRKKI